MDKDTLDRDQERLLVEEQERGEIEMRAGMASAQLSAGDDYVKVFEALGNPYDRINAMKAIMSA